MMTQTISLRGLTMLELVEIMTLDLMQIPLQLVVNFSILLQSFQEPKTFDWTDSHQKTSGVKNIMKIHTQLICKDEKTKKKIIKVSSMITLKIKNLKLNLKKLLLKKSKSKSRHLKKKLKNLLKRRKPKKSNFQMKNRKVTNQRLETKNGKWQSKVITLATKEKRPLF